MQHFLRHLGITRSYLFLNTFCYPIFGQYGDHLRDLAQDPGSPIVAHRHRIFDYVVERNELQLVIGVGTAAKESVATWLRSHAVDADPRDLDRASPGAVSPALRALGVLHPGGATGGGSSAIREDFQRAVQTVERWRSDDPGWLAVDTDGVASTAAAYRYRSAPVPFRDLPFGTPWRLGRGATSSNRKDGQRSIQLFSAAGHYNGRGDDPTYSGTAPGAPEGYRDESGDLPYEPPRVSSSTFDRVEPAPTRRGEPAAPRWSPTEPGTSAGGTRWGDQPRRAPVRSVAGGRLAANRRRGGAPKRPRRKSTSPRMRPRGAYNNVERASGRAPLANASNATQNRMNAW